MLTAIVLTLAAISASPAESWRIDARDLSLTLSPSGMAALLDKSGHVYATGGGSEGIGILRITQSHWAESWSEPEESGIPRESVGVHTRVFGSFAGLTSAGVACTTEIDSASGDLVLKQQAITNDKGVWGVQWTLGAIPLDMNIIIPGRSGIRLTRTTPTIPEVFDYPIEWEAQLVIVEGQGHGCYLWADDPAGRFKRLAVKRTPEGWRLGFITMNTGPCDSSTGCSSVPWHIAVYEGDWRVPARRYRDWAAEHFEPTPIVKQRPDWVKDIRACVIMGLDLDMLEALPARMVPGQTLLYVSHWRKAGYDRDYPVYDQPRDGLGPFVARAHELGFRVMLHVNYFGVDPLNPLYAQFEPYQVRSFWGTHERQWWLWERANPIIKFAYINPALMDWRLLFVKRMKALCRDYAIDALHLDQTLCIYNDYNGPIDGVSMLQGNVLLHRELREALPDIALSGEGLNEVTYRHEAFAQRHAFGLFHANGTFEPELLATAHPISAFLLGPYTRVYGYLGYASPMDSALYTAWNDAYEHWGVIPTLRPAKNQLQHPTGFSKQFFDEAAFWFKAKPEPDWDASWPEEVVFPFRTADGSTAVRTRDGVLRWGDREISRTLRNAAEVALPGTIPGWLAFDGNRLLGLDPSNAYPYLAEPRDSTIFHVTQLPQGAAVSAIVKSPTIAAIRTTDLNACVVRLANELGNATCSSEPANGTKTTVTGPIDAMDGGSFRSLGKSLFAHPPWKTSGSGVTRALFTVHLPEDGRGLRFTTQVALDGNSAISNRSDGVTFGVTATSGELVRTRQLHHATAAPEPLELDLTPFAGHDIALALTVDPGPSGNASFDRSLWHDPRIERTWRTEGIVRVAGASSWSLALSEDRAIPLDPAQTQHSIPAASPGTLYLLKSMPATAAIPVDMASADRSVVFVSGDGFVLDSPLHAKVEPRVGVVADVPRKGIFVHPPNHGLAWAMHALTLPANPAEFHAWIGICDGSMSKGITARVDVNGVEIAAKTICPGAWQEVTADLSRWAGKPVVLAFITDADGEYNGDWVQWGEPIIRAKP